MFERFSHRAREVVVLAQEEARILRHDHIGSEHLLLGILRVGGPGAVALESSGVSADEARNRVVDLVGPGKGVPAGQMPFTPRAKRALEEALRRAMALGENHIGDEHLLLGLVRQPEGVAAEVLAGFGVDRGRLASRALDAAAEGVTTEPPSAPALPMPGLSPAASEVLGRALELARERGAEEAEADDLRRALEEIDENSP